MGVRRKGREGEGTRRAVVLMEGSMVLLWLVVGVMWLVMGFDGLV